MLEDHRFSQVLIFNIEELTTVFNKNAMWVPQDFFRLVVPGA